MRSGYDLVMKPSLKIGAALAFCAAAALAPCSTLAQPVPATIHSLAVQAAKSSAQPSGPYDERGWLDRFYGPRKYAPAWNPSTAAAALWVLGRATLEGLDPRDYGTEALQRQLRAGAADAARFDVALTSAMLHYLADLRVGRVRSEYHTRLPDARLKQYDPVERLRAGLSGGKLQAAVKAAEPQLRLYGQARAVLARYRELAKQPYPALPAPPAKVAPGAAYPAARDLFERLVLLGDLPADAAPPPDGVYGESMEEGVQHFQARHGLLDDGVLGRGTIDALNVSPAQRVRQLELTLERLRWLPDVGRGPLIMVDLPAYRLWALENGSDAAGNDAQTAEAPLEMRVVVGALKTETPLFVGQMRYLEFNPYWNVPRSILEKEILPKMARNPKYLAQNEMETVPANASVADLKAGRARVRQRPGPKNALGAIKFAMPNPMDIYLHSTPAREAFQRSRRDLSHGCIRVEHPAALAQFVLGRQRQWNADTIQDALQPGPTRHVDLAQPIPVVIFYATAVVDSDGSARFTADIYGRDAQLRQALAARPAPVIAIAKNSL
jgi:murein L,D-transpeptidase YcbB/YkuD